MENWKRLSHLQDSMKLHFFKHVFSWLAPEGPPGVLGDVFFASGGKTWGQNKQVWMGNPAWKIGRKLRTSLKRTSKSPWKIRPAWKKHSNFRGKLLVSGRVEGFKLGCGKYFVSPIQKTDLFDGTTGGVGMSYRRKQVQTSGRIELMHVNGRLWMVELLVHTIELKSSTIIFQGLLLLNFPWK